MTIIDAIHDDRLFKPCFRDLSTWAGWLVLLKALFGLEMTDKERQLYEKCTGRKDAPQGLFKEVWAIIGRRGGKTYMMAVIAMFLGLFFDFSEYLSLGELGVVQLIAIDRPTAGVPFRYIGGILHSNPIFEQYIVNETKESIELSTGVVIEVTTCSFRTIRGRTLVAGLLDEACFWRVDGCNPDREVVAALRPSMATIPNSLLLAFSSAYAKAGVVFEMHTGYFDVDDPDILVWQAETRVMNPTISQDLLTERLRRTRLRPHRNGMRPFGRTSRRSCAWTHWKALLCRGGLSFRLQGFSTRHSQTPPEGVRTPLP